MENLQKLPALQSLYFQTQLVRSNMLLVEPIVDKQLVWCMALKLRSPTLKKIVIHVGERIFFCVEKGIAYEPGPWDEFSEWQNWHRKKWVVNYDDEQISIQELASVEDAESLTKMTDLLGLPFDPPKTWCEFKHWKQELWRRFRAAGFAAIKLSPRTSSRLLWKPN